MKKKSMTEQQIKKALDVENWDNLSKDKLSRFTVMLPNIDNEVAIKILDQFPEFAHSATVMVECLKELCDSGLDANSKSTDQCMAAYKQILDQLALRLQKEDISESDTRYIVENMIEVADKMNLKDTENKAFINNVLQRCSKVAAGTLVVLASLLAARAINNNDAVDENNADDDDDEEYVAQY